MQILAIDPGAKGGLVYGDCERPTAVNMPPELDTEEGLIKLHNLILHIRSEFPNIHAVVEKVGGYVGVDQPASSAFKFGSADAAVKAMLIAAGIRRTLVAPITWQNKLELPKRPKTPKGKAQHKRDLRDLAKTLFPTGRVTLDTADAYLIYHLKRTGRI